MSEFISLNETVIFQKEKVMKAIKLVPKKLVVFEKLRFYPEAAVGCKFGTLFQVKNTQLTKVEAGEVEDFNFAEDDSINTTKDNRSLTDLHGESQTLKRDDLLEMKEKGATGEEIIESLVKNSSSFSDKTAFSQKKYLKKKQKKYSSFIRILRPTGRTMCKLYQEREPSKICQLRLDIASQILTFSNIQHGSKVVVLETCSGVLLGMIMERLGGKGLIVNLHIGETPANLFAVSHFNFKDEFWDCLHSLPLHKVGPLLSGKPFSSTFAGDIVDPSEDKLKVGNKSGELEIEDKLINNKILNNEDKELKETKTEGNLNLDDKIEDKIKNGDKNLKRKQLSEEEKQRVRCERRLKRFNHQKKAWETLGTKNMDALIVACRFHPTPIVLSLLETLGNSRPFAIYNEYREPLMELFVRLSVSNSAINLQLVETFTREYQVLPERTHPKVQMSSGGGFLLTGIKVDNN